MSLDQVIVFDFRAYRVLHKGGDIHNIRFVENEDGSANIIMDMDEDIKDFFAAEGVRRVLRDAVEALAEKYESEK